MDWTLAMAQESGVWSEAGQLALHSYLEGLHTLASCAPAPSLSAPRLKSCIQCVESQLLVVIMSVCMLVCQLQNVCVCVHAHACMYLFPVPSGSGCHFRLSALSPATSVPQPEREMRCSWTPHCIWAAGPELV
uniref:cDNA: FLJ22027 fis, clone HEP08551 n=1 Tax=Homo sapiens TaxID=9606 RepID=Q9H6P2_HUMAN|nr:unnamed protein product [Homo sapiens]